MKKIISCMLCVITLLSLIPVKKAQAAAPIEITETDFYVKAPVASKTAEKASGSAYRRQQFLDVVVVPDGYFRCHSWNIDVFSKERNRIIINEFSDCPASNDDLPWGSLFS